MINMVDALAAVGPFAFNGGLKYDSEGRIVVTTTNPVASYANGLPFDTAGNLCVVIA